MLLPLPANFSPSYSQFNVFLCASLSFSCISEECDRIPNKRLIGTRKYIYVDRSFFSFSVKRLVVGVSVHNMSVWMVQKLTDFIKFIKII